MEEVPPNDQRKETAKLCANKLFDSKMEGVSFEPQFEGNGDQEVENANPRVNSNDIDKQENRQDGLTQTFHAKNLEEIIPDSVFYFPNGSRDLFPRINNTSVVREESGFFSPGPNNQFLTFVMINWF